MLVLLYQMNVLSAGWRFYSIFSFEIGIDALMIANMVISGQFNSHTQYTNNFFPNTNGIDYLN